MFDDQSDLSDLSDEARARASQLDLQISLLVRDALATEWVRPLADVVENVAEELGVADPEVFSGLETIIDNTIDDFGEVRLLGDQVVEVTRFAESASFTHRLSSAEVDGNTIELDVDLSLLGVLADVDGGLHRPSDAVPLDLRERVEFAAELGATPRVHQRLVGPDGWLRDFEPGDVVVVRAEDGYLHVEAAPAELPTAASVAERLGDQIAEAVATETEGDGSPIGADELVLRALVEGWWPTDEVLPPLREIAEAAGLEVEGHRVGPPGCWEKDAQLRRVVGAFMRHVDHLDDKTRSALTGFIKAFDDFLAHPSEAPDPALASALHRRRGYGAMCLHEELQRIDPTGEQILAFADAMPMPRGPAATVKLMLESLGRELSGDPHGAEEAAEAAARAESGWYPALDARMGFLEAGGNLRDVVNVMAVLREPDDPELVRLRDRLRLLSPDVGRNEPCPCGSGRKFKQCHLGRTELPAEHRAAWLLERAVNWVERYAYPDIDVARHAVEAVDGGASSDDTISAVLADVVLFELGGLRRFVDARRHLLPPDDVALVDSWLVGERTSLFRVEGIADDGTLRLVDAAGGDPQTFAVARTEAFSSVSVHGLLWCRLLPAGEGWVSSGVVMPLRLQQRAAVLEALEDRAALPGDGDVAAYRTAVVAYLRKLYGVDGPSRLSAGDGSPWVHGVSSWHAGDDRAAITAVLDEAFGSGDGDDGEPEDDVAHQRRGDRQWTRLDDEGTVLATLRLTGCLGAAVCSASPPVDDEAIDDGLHEADLDDDEFDPDVYSAYSARIDSGVYGYDVSVIANSIPRLDDAESELQRLLPDAVRTRRDVTPGRRHHAFLRVDQVMESIYSGGGLGDYDDYDYDVDPDLDDEFGEFDDEFDDETEPPAAPSRLDEVMDQVPEELREQVLEEVSRAYEERWVDMEIPALGGRTPREAAADPDLRPDLLTLLAEFEPLGDLPGQMSTARIRTLLGLDPA